MQKLKNNASMFRTNILRTLYTSSKSRGGKFIDDRELGKELGIQAMSMRRDANFLS
ncbi:hypothetical protein Bandiella_00133 [Candidatus Bandiella woodruffii]|uniref:Uncharacterized protein n=1 Tax=Candidatus Bandiella euplotis TaxID=1664265 RepID=A0ABZ0UMM0_9RICK|nr:hypothetical protein Bandiella_00133 [Candidatus Bandiella woodruffii]